VDKYEIHEVFKQSLDSLCEIISESDYKIHLYGRADSTGNEDSNMLLSRNRVEAVYEYIISKGIDPELVVLDYFGENKPLISDENTIELSANRSVLISVLYVEENDKSTREIWQEYEPDLVIETDKGTVIEIEAGAFFPYKLSDVDFEINEVYSICDILNNGSSLQTDDGNCLSSAGMLYVKPQIDNEVVQPNGGSKVTIKIPLLEGQEYDPDMKLYFEDNGEKKGKVWKEYEAELSFEQGNPSYYVFEVSEFKGMNIDKTFGLVCEKTGPEVKIRGFKSSDVCQIYPDEMYLSRGDNIKRRTYKLDEVDLTKEPKVVVVATDKHGISYLADESMLDLKYRKRKDRYIVKRKSFKYVNSADKTPEKIMCGAINGEEGLVSR